ncbi:hypothetical protein GCM10022200_12250 [Microbacterium awajiense]|uniref:FtsK domain-containing protein n=1 Tax=Microbacterium awajiense TaxID=415214 RepID=A0ABP7AF71_9MICO
MTTALDAAEPLVLPDAWEPPARPPLPLVASTVPMVGAVVLWAVTGSMLTLWLAALGPLIALASVLDHRRATRSGRRRADSAAAGARRRVAAEIEARHARERAARWLRHPDVAGAVTASDAVWREREVGGLVIGAGEVASSITVAGGRGDQESTSLRARASVLDGAPVVVDPRDGVVVVGQGVAAAAVHRALVLQLALTAAPGSVRLVGPLRGGDAWAAELPHRLVAEGSTLALAATADADLVIARADSSRARPARCAVVVRVDAPGTAVVSQAGIDRVVVPEAIAMEQAVWIARDLAARAERTLGVTAAPPASLSLSSLPATSRATQGRDALEVAFGIGDDGPALVDLVADGPHAIVAGITGSGKSELLISWIVALCAMHSTTQVTFLLADFKGGSAFEPLAGLPHVVGVVTDLDGGGARRALESLRAEIRRREGALADAGARDILDPRVELPRLVVVVDEFAALLADHPELDVMFTDLAARGRALGIHLVLGTQRVTGVVRERLLANVPLRLSLRVADPVDSRTVVGSDAAARIPGGVAGRGVALVRRAGDAVPERVRVARADADDIARVIERAAGQRAPRTWLPPLPRRVELPDLVRADDEIALGLADEPERQRQVTAGLTLADRGLAVVGGAGSGLTTVIDVISAQADRLVRVPADLEQAWDAVCRATDVPVDRGTVVAIDDLDALLAGFPPEYAQELRERLEHLARTAGATGSLVVASARRPSGPVARVLDLLPRRLLLPLPSRTDHVAAGGSSEHYLAGAPPGRARLDGIAVQVATAPRRPVALAGPPSPWHPSAPLTGWVGRPGPTSRAALAAWRTGGVRVVSLDEYVADPTVTADGRVLVHGDADDWQRHWRVLASLRGDHHLAIDAACAAEYRVLTASRALPPFCHPGRGRAWLIDAGADAVRVVLPQPDVGSEDVTESS